MARKPGFFQLYGGKAAIAPWIVANLPPHDAYVEPFAGGARVLFAKPRCRFELINDLDKGIVSAFRAARDYPDQLAAVLALTPYARGEFQECSAAANSGYPDDVIEAARTFLVLSQMARFKKAGRAGYWQLERGNDGHGASSHSWASLPAMVRSVAERLRGTAIDNRDGLDMIRFVDGPRMMIYADPPYHPDVCDLSGYRHRLSAAQHAALIELLAGCRSMVALSGYRTPLYDETLAGWYRLDRRSNAASANGSSRFTGRPSARTECLWFNPAAWAAREAAGIGSPADAAQPGHEHHHQEKDRPLDQPLEPPLSHDAVSDPIVSRAGESGS